MLLSQPGHPPRCSCGPFHKGHPPSGQLCQRVWRQLFRWALPSGENGKTHHCQWVERAALSSCRVYSLGRFLFYWQRAEALTKGFWVGRSCVWTGMGGQGQKRGWRQRSCHSSRTEALGWLSIPCSAVPSLGATGSGTMGTVMPWAANACPTKAGAIAPVEAFAKGWHWSC